MQFLAMIASFVFGRMNGPSRGGLRDTVLELFEDVVLKGRKPVILFLAGICAIAFFVGGLFIAILEGTTQYDRVGYVTLTSTLGAGIAMFLVAAIGFVYVFAFAWPGASRHAEHEKARHEQEHKAGSLEQALSILVMDFVKEREVRRQREYAGSEHPGTSRRDRKAQSEASSTPIH